MSAIATTEKAGFDYSALSGNAARVARDAADRIHGRHRDQMTAIIETGRDLATVKASLEHGQFLIWIETEFGMNRRTAVNYMQAAAEFDGKWETVSHLPAKALYALSSPSTPAEFREEIVAEIEAGGRPATGDITERLREAKKAHFLATGTKERRANGMVPA